jgi:ArsR family transcriptional regulator
MDLKDALIAFESLSQDTRLRAFRLLVEFGPEGAAAGTLREALNIPHNTLSFHLSHMSKAKLVSSLRKGRSIIYNANFQFFADLIRFMVENCCRSDMASIRDGKRKGRSIIELTNFCDSSKVPKGGGG